MELQHIAKIYFTLIFINVGRKGPGTLMKLTNQYKFAKL